MLSSVWLYAGVTEDSPVYGGVSNVKIDADRENGIGVLLIFCRENGQADMMCSINIASDKISIHRIDTENTPTDESFVDIFARQGPVGCLEKYNQSADIHAQRYIVINESSAADFFKCFSAFYVDIEEDTVIEYMQSQKTLPKGRQIIGGDVAASLIFSENYEVFLCQIIRQILSDIIIENSEDICDEISQSLSYVSTDIAVTDIIKKSDFLKELCDSLSENDITILG